MIGRESKYSLYDQDLVTFEEGAVAYDHRDAQGFIKLNALRLRTLGQRKRKLKLEQSGEVGTGSPEDCANKEFSVSDSLDRIRPWNEFELAGSFYAAAIRATKSLTCRLSAAA